MNSKVKTRMKEQVQQFLEQGFCCYEGVLDAREQDQIRAAMDNYWQAQGGGGIGNEFGFGINPLLPAIPELAQFLAHPLIVETLRELFDDEVHLVHAGARMSNQSSGPRIGWHNHYSWDASEVPNRARPTRALAGIYVDGTQPQVGPLIALPRRVEEPIGEPRGAGLEAWPGEVEVIMAPGSIAIFDTTLWHAAKAGTKPGMRRLFGAHYQGWQNPRSHPEDNACNVPEVEEYKRSEPRFRSLVERA